jgi:hypothetical protein
MADIVARAAAGETVVVLRHGIRGGVAPLVGQQLGIHQPRGVVDGHMQHLPAGAAVRVAWIAGGAVPRPAHDAPSRLVSRWISPPGAAY